jgi:signal transduction histidine kinase
LLTSGGVELLFSYRESVEAIGALQREMAQGAAFKIQQFVLDIERTLRAATQTQDIVRSGLTEPYQFELLKLLKMTPALTELIVLDTRGHEQFIVSRVRILLSDDLRDRASSEAFQEARRGKTFFGQVYFIRESEPYMTIAVPIERFHGDVVGVLVAEVNLKYIWDVVSHIEVGKAGYAYVVSREGDLIAHPDISLVLQKRQVKQLSQVQAALAGASTRFVERPNLAGQQVFAAFATIPELGWAVLLERPVAEAYAPLYASILRTGMLLLVGLGMALLASLLISRRVVRPLALLQHGAARLGSGDLDYRLAVTTADEFQTLADEFNHMASQLQASHADLEQKVEERTHELARSVQELQALEEISQAINSTLDLQTVLTTIVSYAVQLSGADAGAVYEYDEATQEFSLRIAQELEVELLTTLRTTPLHLGEGAIGQAAAGRQPVQIPDVYDTAPYPGHLRDVVARTGFRSLLAVPLLREDHIIGGLVVLRQAPGAFPPAVVELLCAFATQSALAMQNARLFREIDEKGQQLELASRHKSEFLANMSHELRTPLNSIIGFSEVLLDESLGELPREEQREFQGNVLSSGRHLLTLINDILDLSKVEAGRMELYPETFTVAEVVHGVIQTVHPLAARKQIAIEAALDPALHTLLADPGKVKQILFNLLSNAVKFTPVGGRIRVRTVRGQGVAHFVVWDTGIGIKPEDQGRIFEAFQQVETAAARQYEGTGLGLALAQQFVTLHGGRIWVESTPGQGSTFTFTLPLSEPPLDKGGA